MIGLELRPNTPSEATDEVHGEVPSDRMGTLELEREDIQGDPNMIFEDKRKLRGKLRKLVHTFHNEGMVIFARVKHPEKKLVLTLISAAAVGMVGIGRKVRTKGERKK